MIFLCLVVPAPQPAENKVFMDLGTAITFYNKAYIIKSAVCELNLNKLLLYYLAVIFILLTSVLKVHSICF